MIVCVIILRASKSNDIYLYIFAEETMKRYKVSQVLKLLRMDGWVVVRIRGDHRQLRNAKGKPGTVTISGKRSDTLSQGVLISIWKQAGWKTNDDNE